jgi:hypothetical protein
LKGVSPTILNDTHQMPCLHKQQGEFLRALIRADITIVEGWMNFPSANPE